VLQAPARHVHERLPHHRGVHLGLADLPLGEGDRHLADPEARLQGPDADPGDVCKINYRVRVLRLFRHTLRDLLRDEPGLTLKLLDGIVRRMREVQRDRGDARD